MTEAASHSTILSTEGLRRDFGGIHAVQHVSLSFTEGLIHAVIGPNGAGKTTLINLLSGDTSVSGGRVFFGETDITDMPPHQINHLGIGRSYQQTHIIGDMTCLENCRLGAQSQFQSKQTGFMSVGMRFFHKASGYDDINAAAAQALDQIHLTERAHDQATDLSHGERRQLEIAMVLATNPSLLLLDEPLAGMGVGDARRMIDLLKEISAGRTIILIEHDMDAVFELADVLTVMVDGQVLKTGSPDEVRADAQVQQAYLGEADIREDRATAP